VERADEAAGLCGVQRLEIAFFEKQQQGLDRMRVVAQRRWRQAALAAQRLEVLAR
jgi:hypothetical protein